MRNINKYTCIFSLQLAWVAGRVYVAAPWGLEVSHPTIHRYRCCCTSADRFGLGDSSECLLCPPTLSVTLALLAFIVQHNLLLAVKTPKVQCILRMYRFRWTHERRARKT
jgi:hypothetical protein